MPRDTSNSATKARNSKHAAATGLKTGNLKTKGTPAPLKLLQERPANPAPSTRRRELLPRCQVGQAGQHAERKEQQRRPRRLGPDHAGGRVPEQGGHPGTSTARPPLVRQHADHLPDGARALSHELEGEDCGSLLGRPQEEQASHVPAL